jgi:hypothetical protein
MVWALQKKLSAARIYHIGSNHYRPKRLMAEQQTGALRLQCVRTEIVFRTATELTKIVCAASRDDEAAMKR